jgi:imidazolonepropionase
MLRVARRIGETLGITVRTTYLGAHALPPEFAGRADEYIDAVVDWLPTLHGEGLVDAVDAFCEGIGFSPAQTRRVFEAARTLGLPVKLHADQLSDLGGAALAAEFGGLSADHVEYTNEDAVRAMASAGTVAVLLPGAFHCLRETKLPPLAAFREHGVPMAVATDCNPGTAPVLSLREAMSLACTHFRLTPEEALRTVLLARRRPVARGLVGGRTALSRPPASIRSERDVDQAAVGQCVAAAISSAVIIFVGWPFSSRNMIAPSPSGVTLIASRGLPLASPRCSTASPDGVLPT